MNLGTGLKVKTWQIIKKNPILYVKLRYRRYYGRWLNFSHPKLLSEKLMVARITSIPYDKKIVTASDKYTLVNYLISKGLQKYCTSYLAVYTNANEFSSESLPDSYVIKKTNASGLNLIVKNKHDIQDKRVKEILNQWFEHDFGLESVEPHYSKSKDRVICEPFFSDIGDEIRLFMVSGRLAFVQTIIWDWNKEESSMNVAETSIIEGHRKHYRIHLDENWHILSQDEDTPKVYLEKPSNWDEMLKVARVIAEDFDIVRVDFNMIEEKLKIMELTFTPASGLLNIFKQRPDLDEKYGKWLG